jgi:hypothetical protein
MLRSGLESKTSGIQCCYDSISGRSNVTIPFLQKTSCSLPRQRSVSSLATTDSILRVAIPFALTFKFAVFGWWCYQLTGDQGLARGGSLRRIWSSVQLQSRQFEDAPQQPPCVLSHWFWRRAVRQARQPIRDCFRGSPPFKDSIPALLRLSTAPSQNNPPNCPRPRPSFFCNIGPACSLLSIFTRLIS